ncbi:hypothetical protein [Zobellella taiwanensis]
MLPIPALLAMAYGPSTLADAASTAVNVGNKILRASLNAGAKASKVSFTFIKGGIEAVHSQSQASLSSHESKVQKISKPLEIIENGLSIPLSFYENQVVKMNNDISNDLMVLKGQNEIHFLSNSIRYFVDSHMGRTGIDRGISYALQYDMKAVTNHLKANSSLRFPGYLLHQSTCLYKTIKEMNIFYDAILHDGHVKDWTPEEVKDEMQKFFGVESNKKYIQNYMPFDLQLPIRRELAENTKEKKSFINFQNLFSADEEHINDIAHDALFILANELIANENLEHEVAKKISREPNKEILLESSSPTAS